MRPARFIWPLLLVIACAPGRAEPVVPAAPPAAPARPKRCLLPEGPPATLQPSPGPNAFPTDACVSQARALVMAGAVFLVHFPA